MTPDKPTSTAVDLAVAKTIAAAKGQFDRLESELESARASLEQSEKELRFHYEQGEEARKRVKELEAEVGRLRSCIDDHNGELNELFDRLAAKSEALEKMEKSRDSYATGMRIALEDGVFATKESTKKRIEQVLRAVNQSEGKG